MRQDPLAIFAIVQNEPVWLPIWVDFYRRHVDPEHLYVLDHDSTGEGAAVLHDLRARFGIQVVPVHRRESFDHAWLRDTVARFQRFLLASYRAVLFAEVDEIVSPTPGSPSATLTEYSERVIGRPEGRRSADYVKCRGYEVVHQPEVEPAIDWKRPLLAQRSKWYESRLYSKTLLSQVPLTWENGFHDLERKRMRRKQVEPDLILVHLHKIDYEFCRARHEEAAKRRWSAADLESGAGRQNRFVDDDELDSFFATTIDDRKSPAPLVDIPEPLKSIV